MTAALSVVQDRRGSDVGVDDGLWQRVDPGFLATIRWDAALEAARLPLDHDVADYAPCARVGCARAARVRGVCPPCYQQRRRQGRLDDASFLATPPSCDKGVGEPECRVDGCSLPSPSNLHRLCTRHDYQRERSGQPLGEFLQRDDLLPHPGLGSCAVPVCIRRAATGKARLCHRHLVLWGTARTREPELELKDWAVKQLPVEEPGLLVLRGLPRRLQGELLYGVQESIAAGHPLRWESLTAIVRTVRRQRPDGVRELGHDRLDGQPLALFKRIQHAVHQASRTLEEEMDKEDWDLTLWGYRGSLRLGGIPEGPFREAARAWANGDLGVRRGRHVRGSVQRRINSIARLASGLATRRPDRGLMLSALGRADLLVFSHELRRMERAGEMSPRQRIENLHNVAYVLDACRSQGLMGPGKPLHGLPADFALGPQDLPALPGRQSGGRNLPAPIVSQLVEQLPHYGRRDLDLDSQNLTRLLMETGRRPEEICNLPQECLEWTIAGGWVLTYDDLKSDKPGQRLPVTPVVATVIRDQQGRNRIRSPRTPPEELALFPASRQPAGGRRRLTAQAFACRHRTWVDSLPELSMTTPEGLVVPYDRARVVPYAYRYTYVQSLYDAEVKNDVIKELMGHESVDVTLGYRTLSERQKRQAVDRLAPPVFERPAGPVARPRGGDSDGEGPPPGEVGPVGLRAHYRRLLMEQERALADPGTPAPLLESLGRDVARARAHLRDENGSGPREGKVDRWSVRAELEGVLSERRSRARLPRPSTRQGRPGATGA